MPKHGADTPMMEQYRRIKREHRGEVLFFRLGDFYEMFSDDAIEVSALLNLTLTSRSGQPMCGIPYHASHSYIARLLKLGKKIAICEQLTEPGRGLVEREVTEVITPGTTVEEDYLEKGNSNYLACLASSREFLSFSYIDVSAGEFFATSFPAEGAAARLRQELEGIQAREIIIQESLLNGQPALAAAIEGRAGMVVNRWADWLFDPERSRERLERQFGANSLKAFGLAPQSPEIVSSGALLDYLDDTAHSLIPHVRGIRLYGESEFVGIDESTQRNLELVRNLLDGDSRYSLLEVMDETKTAMGRRLLRNRILHPLRSEDLINRRLDMVEILYHSQERLGRLREILSKTPDLERLCSRLAMDKAHGKDMVALKNALFSFAAIEDWLRQHSPGNNETAGFVFESPDAASLKGEGIPDLEALAALLEKGIAEDPAIVLTEGNLIRDGYSQELDRLRTLKDSGRGLLEEYLEEEREATGISGLKIKYNRLIGYFFEVTNLNISRVPPRFIRRQGIAGGERFTTDRLAGLESEINSAQDRIVALEKKLFLELRDKAKAELPAIAAAGKIIAEMDTAQSMARAATIRGWNRPFVDSRNRIKILDGRHPVVEAHLPRGEFIPNDLALDARPSHSSSLEGDAERKVYFALITGPNMAGKSTYLRQAALITLMAQAGSFVPASEARIGLVDRIFCRVGASDNLARGESTFLVEMNETAYILHTATDKSLVIMDEVGRGTGTEDGLSIAWAVCEELLNGIKCRALFATHYHELSRITHPGMANRSMDVAERDGGIVFLRKLKEGPTEESYGLHVAALAGLPDRVLERAGEIMDSISEQKQKKLPDSIDAPRPPAAQGQLAKGGPLSGICNDLMSIDPNALTPLDALCLLQKWKQSITGAGQTAAHPPVHQSALKGQRPNKAENGTPGLFDL